jgi:hypothetical protein
MAAYRSDGADAATVRVRFRRLINNEEEEDATDKYDSFLPRVGQWYNQSGQVKGLDNK